MKRILHLKYSKIGTVPVFGYLFYAVQLCLLKTHFATTLYISAKDKRYIHVIVNEAEKNFDVVRCESLFIGHPLIYFTKQIILSVQMVDSEKMNLNEETIYSRVLWTLATARSIDKQMVEAILLLWGMDFSVLIPLSSV